MLTGRKTIELKYLLRKLMLNDINNLSCYILTLFYCSLLLMYFIDDSIIHI